MPNINEDTRSRIPTYSCEYFPTGVSPAFQVESNRVSFGGRMLCSSCLDGKCHMKNPLVPCDLIDEAKADNDGWEAVNRAYREQRKKEKPTNPLVRSVARGQGYRWGQEGNRHSAWAT